MKLYQKIKLAILAMLIMGGASVAIAAAAQQVYSVLTTYEVVALPNKAGPPTPSDGDTIKMSGYGIQGNYRRSDTATRNLTTFPQSIYPSAATNTTGGSSDNGVGWGRRTIAVTSASCGTDTITLTINGTAADFVEGTDWHAGASNAAGALSLTNAINARAASANYVIASNSSGNVYLTRNLGASVAQGPGAMTLTLSTNDGACASFTTTTDGDWNLWAPLTFKPNGASISNGTNNEISRSENSETLTETYSTNLVTLSSGTGVTAYNFGDVLPQSSTTGAVGWALVAGANVACNTTCTYGCIVGQDTGGANKPLVACNDATADQCLCMGPN